MKGEDTRAEMSAVPALRAVSTEEGVVSEVGVSTPPERFTLHTIGDVLNRRPPAWLIEGLFTVGAIVGVYGAPGGGKSFLALDWALSIAYGRAWAGRSVKQGPVVYVAAEGGAALGSRIAAWRTHWGFKTESPAFFILESVQVHVPEDVGEVLARVEERALSPSLILIDTLARCFVGGDENSSKEMGAFIEGIETLRRKSGAAVMFVHHSGKSAADVERGSTSLRGAADAMFHIGKTADNMVTLTNNKQKDHEECAKTTFRLEPVRAGHHGETSCVLVPASCAITQHKSGLTVAARKTLEALASAPDGVAKRNVWKKQSGIVAPRTFDNHRDLLVQHGLVTPTGKHGEYRVTDAGLQAVEVAGVAEELRAVNGNTSPCSDVAASATTP